MNVRNTQTHRVCPECKGEGSLEVRYPSTPPGEETVIPCDFEGCEDGWVRFRDEDPLENDLRILRDRFIRGWPNRQYSWQKYSELRRLAFFPVRFPPHGIAYYHAVRDADNARSLFRMFGLIRAAGGQS